MYQIKGFMGMPTLANNKLDKTAKFGELTTRSKTFTRDMREYAQTKYPDVVFWNFFCYDQMNVRVEPSATFMGNILAMGQWVYQQHDQKLIPANKNKPAFIAALADAFPMITGVIIGEILAGDVADKNMPDFIQFKMLDGSRSYQGIVWFADDSFKNQYPEYEIFVIPPLPDVNDLIGDKTVVDTRIRALPPTYHTDAFRTIRGPHPETELITYELKWHDPSDFNSTLRTYFNIVVYGEAGTDTEAIKEAIRDYLEANSDYTKWPEIYPDLYNENEFIILPDWANIAIPENAKFVGQYRSILHVRDMYTKINALLPNGYQNTPEGGNHLDENLFTGAAYYRTIMFAALGNPNNRDKVFDLRTIFPDYMAINNQDPDFVRMDPITQGWCLVLAEALDIAYSYGPNDLTPNGFTKVIRRSVHYIAFVYEGYTYAICTRFSFERQFGTEG